MFKDRLTNKFPKRRSPLSPLSPVLGGEGLGVRGQHRVVVCRSPLTPNPSPPSKGRGEEDDWPFREVGFASVLRAGCPS